MALLLGGLLRPEPGGSPRPPSWPARTTALPAPVAGPALARRIGSVFQDPEHQFVTSTVFDELALGPAAPARARPPSRRQWPGCWSGYGWSGSPPPTRTPSRVGKRGG
ncbi:hypothetical protein NKG94_44980 [Micromonospora sp. M12]